MFPDTPGQATRSLLTAAANATTGSSAACVALTGSTTLVHLSTGAIFRLQGGGRTCLDKAHRHARCARPFSCLRGLVRRDAGALVLQVASASSSCPGQSHDCVE